MADLTTYYAKTHAGEARLATKEMTPLEVGEHLAAIADSADTVTLPNFPSRNIRDSKAMFYIDDNGTGVAAPFSGRRDGAIMINTAFSPTG